MEQGTIKKMRFALIGAAVAAACAFCMLPGMAFASTNVTVNYKNAANVSRSVVVDLDALSADNNVYGYMFQKAGTNNVIASSKSVTLQSVVDKAKQTAGDSADSTVWASGKSMAFTTNGGQAYTKYTKFTYANLTANGYFYADTLATGGPLNAATAVPTVLSLQNGSMAMDSTTTTAQDALDSITTTASASPRLLYGYPSATPTDIGGNRFPTNVDSITIS